ncbi:ABC transporter substrate-binding protein, partial [Enterococcus faecium]|uniref:ABC transporter substrate-binding protein n=2 Tax=Enterococcus faecium TaxID=1352 RepID=UPI003D0D3B11
MKEYIKNIYFIEETQNIEGSYIEVKTLFVNEDKTKALDILLFVKLSETKLSIYVTQKN